MAGDAGVDLVVGQDEDSHLQGVHTVRVVTDQPRHRELPDLLQLLDSEAAGPAPVLVPEPVALPDVVELPADDAGEGGAKQPACDGILCYAGTEQLQVLGAVIQPFVGGHRPVVDNPPQLVPAGDGFEPAELSVLVV